MLTHDYHHTIIPQIYVCLSANFVLRFPRKPFARCTSRSANVLLATRRCAFSFLSLYGYGQVIQLNNFVWCSLAFFANVVVGFPRRCRKKNVSRN